MHLPSTKDLRAFELVARLGSMRAAADEMHLTPSALSRRIHSLEEELGQALFIRDARGLTLTEAGRNYAGQLREVFRTLEAATSNLRQCKKQRLKILAPSYIAFSIVPYLDAFEQSMPDIELELHEQTATQPSDISIPDADIVFSWGNGQWAGWISKHITPNSYITPVCSHQLLHNGQLLSTDEVSQRTWIVASYFEDSWKRWYDALGAPFPKPANLIRVTNGQTANEAALRGHGLVMALGFAGFPPFGVLFGAVTYAHGFHALTPGYGYHLHTRPQNDNPAIARFVQWFFSEIWSPAGMQKALEKFQKHLAK